MAYRDTILATTGLLSYWDMQEKSGTLVADSVSTIDGTMQNGVTGGSMGLIAETGDSSLEYTLGSGHVNFGNNYTFLDTTAFSIEFWIRPRTITANFQRLVNKDWFSASNNRGGWNFLISNNATGDKIRFVRHRNGNANILNSINSAVIDTTYHIVGTYDGSTMRLYINGVLEDSLASAINIPNTDLYAMMTGRRPDTAAEFFDGFMNHMAFYDRELTSIEVTDHYTAGTTTPSFTYDETTTTQTIYVSQSGDDTFQAMKTGTYTVTFTPTDTRSTSTNELYYEVRDQGVLTSGNATSGVSKTTATITDTQMVDGQNNRTLRIRDGAGNITDTAFTVNATFGNTYSHLDPTVLYVSQTGTDTYTVDVFDPTILYVNQVGTDTYTVTATSDEAIVYVPILSDASLSQQEALGEAIIFQVTSGTDTVIYSDTSQILGVNTYIIGDLTFHAQEVANFQTIRINEGGLIDFQMAEIYGAVDVPVLIEGLFGALYTDTGTEIPLAVFVNAESLATFHEQDAELPIYTYLDSVEQIELDESLDALIIEAIISGFDFDPGDSDSAFILVIGHVQGTDDLNMVEPEDAYIAYTTSYAVDSMTWVDYAAEVMAETQVFGIDVQQMLENIAPVIIGTSLEGIDTRVWQEILEAAISRAIIESVDTSVYEDIKPYETGVFIGGTDTPAFTDTFGTVDIFTIITGTDRIPLRLYLRWDEQALMQMQLYTSDLLLDQPYQDLLVQSLVYESDVRTDMMYDSMLELRTVYTGAIDVL